MSRPYPRHCVAWLGQIPEHWEIRPLKTLLARNGVGVWGADPEDGEGTVVLRSTEQTIDGGWSIENPATRVLSTEERTGTLLAAGDLLVTKSSGSESHIGKTSLVTEQVAQLAPCFSKFMQRLRCLPALEPRFAWHLLNSPIGRQQLVFGATTTTGLVNLDGAVLGNVQFPRPPIEEQRSIVSFLDRETAEIDALVERKRLLVERLAEYRTALITRTVTRGLPPDAARAAGIDPNPRLRDSGVEWLGEVPNHWIVKHLGHALAASVGGRTPDTAKEEFWADDEDDGVPWVAIADMSGGGAVTTTQKRVTSLGVADARLRCLPPGTVIYSMYASVGAVARLGMCAVTNQAILGLIPDATVAAPFLYWWLDACRSSLEALVRSNTQSNLNAETVRHLPLIIPPTNEQRAITEFLDRRVHEINDLCALVVTAIERLQEYRTALVTAAVTGKIDVRDTMMPETEELSEQCLMW